MIIVAGTTILTILAVTAFITAPYLFVWKLSIIATEFGHWCALVALGLITWSLFRSGPIHWGRVSLLIASFIFLSRPVVQAYFKQDEWKTQLQQTLKASPRSLISFSNLWFAQSKEVAPVSMVYAAHPEGNLSLDFYRSISPSPSPFVIIIHGGGWDSGERTQLSAINSTLAVNGISVAAISYRLAPTSKWPAQKEDVRAAVAYIKAHAQELGVDPEQWALLGRSAGGQIAEAVAYQSKDPSLRGVIAFYSPSDLVFAYENTVENDILDSRDLLRNLLGGNPDQVPAVYKDASPLEFVSAESVPTLLVHGANDALTWYKHSRRLTEKLRQAGVPCVHIELPWATHGFDFSQRGPAGQISTNAIKVFLSQIFKDGQNSKGVSHG